MYSMLFAATQVEDILREKIRSMKYVHINNILNCAQLSEEWKKN